MTEKMILIHGAFLSARSWENYVRYFTDAGFDVSAVEWPRKSGDVEELREHGDDLAGLGVAEIVDHYDAIIRALDAPPVLVGHSFGGLFVQLLLDRGLGRAGVALDPASPKGVLRIAPSSLKVASPAIAHPGKRHGVVTLTAEQFNYAFTNTFEPAAAAAAFERYAVPETGQIFFEAGLANFKLHSPVAVDYDRADRAPLLFVAGGEDHTIPATTVRANVKKYHGSPARTDLIEFAGRAHFHMVQTGWEEIADAIRGWLADVLGPGAGSTAPTGTEPGGS
jgi:pimeloyl-ACP methyl ester carboxylesterase